MWTNQSEYDNAYENNKYREMWEELTEMLEDIVDNPEEYPLNKDQVEAFSSVAITMMHLEGKYHVC